MRKKMRAGFWVSVLFTLTILANSQSAYAHCDTLDGPVVKEARVALDNENMTPLFKWIRPTDEKMIKETFDMTLDVRTKGKKAKELADMYFFETLVRIHREGEGAPYTGLKPGVAVDPAVALADKALESGSIDKLVNVLTNAMAKGIRERFKHTNETQKHANKSVEAGREFVESYVIFTHYVEGLHGLIKGGAAHHGEKGENH
ncbi:MAG: hypothetical protein GY797_31240 [Deltaproteobacteria bacterium]|nr:hypothetical protein [Deltaproteobacteria bacterium]